MAITYSISDLAQEFDLTTRAIRFYEDMGLLQPQRAGTGGRSRVYTPRDRTRLKLTLRAKRLGLSLVEAKEIIDSYDSPRDTAPQLRKFLVVLTDHRVKLEAQLLDLQANLDEIRSHEKEAKALLTKAEKTSRSDGAGKALNPARKNISCQMRSAERPLTQVPSAVSCCAPLHQAVLLKSTHDSNTTEKSTL